MGKARFLQPNLCTVAGVVITPSSEVADFPAAFLANPTRWKRWRSATSTSDQNVDFDFGSNKNINAVALVDWKGHAIGTIKAQRWTGAAWADLGTFTVPVPNPTKVLALWFALQVSNKLRILFTNTNGSNEYVELGVVVAGTYFEPIVNLTDDLGILRHDPSQLVLSADGQELAQRRTKYFDFTTLFHAIPISDKDILAAMYETHGVATELIFAVDSDVPNQIAYGRLAETFEMRAASAILDRWHVAVPFREAR